MKTRLFAWAALVAALLLVLTPAAPTQAQSEDGVVYAVLFHSPQCPHCLAFIQNDWPVMEREFGDQLNMLFVNVLDPGNRALMERMYAYYRIPDDQRYVPMMFIGDQVFVGGDELPTIGAQTIRDGIKNGGIPMPPVDGLAEAFNQAANENNPSSAVNRPSLTERFQADPIANALAVVVLITLAVSVVVVLTGLGSKTLLIGPLPRAAALVAAVLTALLAISLLVQAGSDVLAMVLSGLAVIGSGLVAFLLARAPRLEDAPRWLTPLAAGVGLAAAFYLATVEVTRASAACGVVGNCNAVQDSSYAMLFGVLPIGVMGIGGYILIIAAWVLTQGAGEVARFGQSLLLGLTLFGAAFSLYLTFLEPFVIGATCVWCLTSALTMLVLLWQVAPGSAPQPTPARRGRSRSSRSRRR